MTTTTEPPMVGNGSLLRQVPGRGLLARHDDLVLLCQTDPGRDDRVAPVLHSIDAVAATGGDGRLLCRRLTGLLSTAGLDADDLPAVCAFGPAGDGVAVLVHGSAAVTLQTASGPVRLSGADAVTCVDRLVPGPVTEIRAALGPSADSDDPDPWSRLDNGVVRAVALVFRPGAATEPELSELDLQMSDVDHWAPAHDRLPDAGAFDVMSADATACPVTAVEGMPAEPTPDKAIADGVTADEAKSFGAVSEAGCDDPIRMMERALMSDAPTSPAPITGTGVRADPMNPAPNGVVGPDEDCVDRVRANGHKPAADAAAWVPAREPLDVDSTVVGVLCKNSHFNDPRVPYCTVCGISMVQQTQDPLVGQRPSLGVLILDDGQVVPLDRGYVLGREPDCDKSVGAGYLRPLRLWDPENAVSRVHARVLLDGWEVKVVDLGSTNGTYVRPLDSPEWIRLRPHCMTTIRPGTRVMIGRRGFRYDSHRNP